MDTQEQSEEKVAKLLRNGYCNGAHCKRQGIAEDSHTCPFLTKVNNDYRTVCDCCEVCTQDCAMDI